MINRNIAQILGLALVLFICFFGYRAYFWGDFTRNIYQVLANSAADTVLSVACGLIMYRVQKKLKLQSLLIPAALILVLVFSSVLYISHVGIYKIYHKLDQDFLMLFNSVCFQLLDSVAIMICGAMAILVHLQVGEKRRLYRSMASLEMENQKVELKYLKSQMDPHFVFNGLNMIYHQVDESNVNARESLLQFAGILRYHLQYAANEVIPLSEELEYLESYIRFQKKRCSDFMQIETRIELVNMKSKIEPLLLLPLIENAFKFCKGADGKKGNLKIDLKNSNEKLEFNVVNTYQPGVNIGIEQSGIGLQNVQRRLSMLYPGRHILDLVEDAVSKTYTCKLILW